MRGVFVVLPLLFLPRRKSSWSIVCKARMVHVPFFRSNGSLASLFFFTPLHRVSGGLLIGAFFAFFSIQINRCLISGLFLTFRKCNKSHHQNELVRFVNTPVCVDSWPPSCQLPQGWHSYLVNIIHLLLRFYHCVYHGVVDGSCHRLPMSYLCIWALTR